MDKQTPNSTTSEEKLNLNGHSTEEGTGTRKRGGSPSKKAKEAAELAKDVAATTASDTKSDAKSATGTAKSAAGTVSTNARSVAEGTAKSVAEGAAKGTQKLSEAPQKAVGIALTGWKLVSRPGRPSRAVRLPVSSA